jgi:hypothetical protein
MENEDTIDMGAVAGKLRALAQDMRLKILVVDDDELERMLVADRLEARGFAVTRATDGADAALPKAGGVAETLQGAGAATNGRDPDSSSAARQHRAVSADIANTRLVDAMSLARKATAALCMSDRSQSSARYGVA